MYIPAQHWMDFIGDNYHFLPHKKLEFNHEHIISFMPTSLYVTPMEVSEMRRVSIILKNIQNSGTLVIYSIWSVSRWVRVIQIERANLYPKDELRIPIFICSPEPGVFSTVIFIKTNKGTFTYNIQYNVQNSAKDSIQQNAFFETIDVPDNVTLKIPSSMKKFDILFDGNIFSREKSSVAKRFVQLVPTITNIGYYTSYINVISPTSHKTYPFSLFASYKHIISVDPIVFVPTVTAKDETQETDIRVVNPTPEVVEIRSITLASSLKDNVKIAHLQYPIKCEPQSYTTIGGVVIDGTYEGEVDTTATITYVISDGSSQIMTIPIKGFVAYGKLRPDKPTLKMVPNFRKSYKINITNEFKVPVSILGTRISSQMLIVENFVPFVLKPGETSKNLTVSPTGIISNDKQEIYLDILTNISKASVPIKLYSGSVYVSLNETHHGKDFIYIKLGKQYATSHVDLHFYVTNPNPDPFIITDIRVPFPLDTNVKFCKYDYKNLIGSYVEPFSTKMINFIVNFRPTDKTAPRNDTIIFSSKTASFSVIIGWEPIPGEIRCATSLPQLLIYGKNYTYDLLMTSSFEESFNMTSLTIITENKQPQTLYFKNSIISKDNDGTVKNLSISVDSNLLESSQILTPLRNSYAMSTEEWNLIAVSPLAFTFDIFFVLNGMYMFKSTFKNYVGVLQYNNIIGQLNETAVSEPGRINVTLFNVLDIPVSYMLELPDDTDTEYSIASKYDLVIPPNQTSTISLTFINENAGLFISRTRVTTNATPPFFISTVNKVVPIKLEPLSEVFVNSNYLSIIGNVNITYMFRSDSQAPIEILDVYSREEGITCEKNATILKPGEILKVEAIFNGVRMLFSNNDINIVIFLRHNLLEYNLSIPLTQRQKNCIYKTKSIIKVLTVLVGLLPIYISLYNLITSLISTAKVLLHKIETYSATVEELSCIRKVSIGISATEEEVDRFVNNSGGKFVFKEQYISTPINCLSCLGEVIQDIRKL